MAHSKSGFGRMLKKVWHFIWEEDSIWSWIVNIVLAFVLIKFVIYPGLGWTLGTTHPVVAVVSGSMEHDGSFDTWWASSAVCEKGLCTQEQYYSEHGITKDGFRRFIFHNGFNTGDIILLVGKKPADITVGDVIVFASSKPYPIIHRVITIKSTGSDDGSLIFTTKGDHNPGSGIDDTNIAQDRIIGKAVVRIPYLGWIKIWFVNLVNFINPFS
jgi:signal peptidase I